VAAIFHAVILRKWWDHGRATGNLVDVVEDDFGAAFVEFHGSVNFNGAPGQPTHVANVFQSGLEDHHRERAGQLILAEVQKMNSLFPILIFSTLPATHLVSPTC
jgi:hypothetical protein